MPEPEVHWTDLAANRPGALARDKALELKRASPGKAFLARALGVHTDERAYRVGADGEEDVGRRLEKLGEHWRVLHSVAVGEKGSDIDHVVIGPGGVFTLNTKNHSKNKVWVAERSFMVNGQKTDYLRNSRFEAKRASALLSAACGVDVAVEPVIVVIAAQLAVKAQPPDVHVVGRKRIVKWLSGRAPVLTPGDVETVYGRARLATTWRPGTSSAPLSGYGRQGS
ncbi:MAG TPA: nuclease-related domain-containing protein [Acidimicrobiales bacterium]